MMKYYKFVSYKSFLLGSTDCLDKISDEIYRLDDTEGNLKANEAKRTKTGWETGYKTERMTENMTTIARQLHTHAHTLAFGQYFHLH